MEVIIIFRYDRELISNILRRVKADPKVTSLDEHESHNTILYWSSTNPRKPLGEKAKLRASR